MLFQSRQYLEKFLNIPVNSTLCFGNFLVIALVLNGCSSVATKADGSPVNPHLIQSQYWKVKDKSVYDGDTFRAINEANEEEIKIRLACIDAPEKKQDMGIASRDYLRSLLNQNPNKLIVVERDRDKYGRVIAEIFIPTGRGDEEIAINAMMINSGNAYYYAQYSKNCSENAEIYANLEKEAKKKKSGIWKYNGLKPWEYRKANR